MLTPILVVTGVHLLEVRWLETKAIKREKEEKHHVEQGILKDTSGVQWTCLVMMIVMVFA